MKIFTEKASKNLIWIGVALILIGGICFVIGESFFDLSSEIKSDKIGQLGDYFGGVIGSLWALAGVILFYVALKRQTEALEDQKESTKATVESLKIQSKELQLQSKELQLQREELQNTREEFKINRLTNILFKQVELINNIISNSKFFAEHKGEIPEKQLTIDKLIFILDTLKSRSNDKSSYQRMDFLITLNTGRIIRLLASVHAFLEGFEKLLNKSSIEEQEINQLKGLLKGNINQDLFTLLRYRVKFIEEEYLDNASLFDQDTNALIKASLKIEISKLQYINEYDKEDKGQ